MKYKFVMLDLDNTLYDTRTSEKEALSKFLDLYAPDLNKQELIKSYKKVNKNFWQGVESGSVNINELNERRFKEFFRKHSINKDHRKASIEYLDLLAEFHIFYPGAREIYEYLTKKYQVVLITNGLKAAQEKRIKNTFLHEGLTPMYIGEIIGYHKPSARVVEYIMEKENWKPKEKIIIIGDSLSSDIQCASNAGISNIWCNFMDEDPGNFNPDYTVENLLEIKNIL